MLERSHRKVKTLRLGAKGTRIRAAAPLVLSFLGLLFVSAPAPGQEPEPLSGTQRLTLTGDMSLRMREGFDRFLTRGLEQSVETRQSLWKRDLSSPQAYVKSIEPNRKDFQRMIGLADTRLPIRALEYESNTSSPSLIAESPRFRAFAVHWQVLDGVFGEGLLLEPQGKPIARVVAIPDADETPEMIVGLAPGVPPENQFARRLAEAGCRVVIPVLIKRQDTWSGNPKIVKTDEPHREWIYRQAYALGRHIIGYEVQKVLSLVDWFHEGEVAHGRIGVVGYGEGGLIAIYAAAVDPRIDAVLVSGYFDSRQRVWDEPLYRNLFGLLAEFGDAEVAGLISPRKLIVEYSEGPEVTGPPPLPAGGRKAGAPGRLGTPAFESVDGEFRRARALLPHDTLFERSLQLVVCQHGLESVPTDVFDAKPGTGAFGLYNNYGARLADQGFVVYAPHNFYRGDDNFHQLQRKANPLKLTLWSITVGQHDQMLNWLSTLPFVDSARIGFYGTFLRRLHSHVYSSAGATLFAGDLLR